MDLRTEGEERRERRKQLAEHHERRREAQQRREGHGDEGLHVQGEGGAPLLGVVLAKARELLAVEGLAQEAPLQRVHHRRCAREQRLLRRLH